MGIKPTVGRKVWYHPFLSERIASYQNSDQPLDATVVHVWSDNCVNLLVFNEEGGRLAGKTSVHLCDSYDQAGPGQAGWMPYQVGQASLTQNVVAPLVETIALLAGAAAGADTDAGAAEETETEEHPVDVPEPAPHSLV